MRTGSGKNVNINGASDVFSIALSGPGGYEVQSSSAVQNIINNDNTVSGYFRLQFGNAASLELPNHISASAMQVALMTLCDPLVSVEVSHKNVASKSIWSVTFLSYLKEWSESPLAILPDLNGDDTVSSLMVIEAVPSNGKLE